MAEFTSRLAVRSDVPALTVLMDAAIAELQRAFLDDAQIASSRAIMGIGSQLIDDATYFVVRPHARRADRRVEQLAVTARRLVAVVQRRPTAPATTADELAVRLIRPMPAAASAG